MAIGFQDKLARSFQAFQDRLMDFNVELTGTKCSTILLEVLEDKYRNEQTVISQQYDITCVFNFPEDEIPVNLSSTDNNFDSSSSNTFHLYDIVPITCYLKTEDVARLKVIKGSIILYKIRTMDRAFQVIPFQILDVVAKGNPSSAILWQEFTVAPVTSYEILNNPQYKEIVDEFKLRDQETWHNNYEKEERHPSIGEGTLFVYYGQTDDNTQVIFENLTRDDGGKSSRQYSFSASHQYLQFVYDYEYGTLGKIKDQNGFDNTKNFTVSIVEDEDTNKYYVYTSNKRITCTNFRYNFIFGEE